MSAGIVSCSICSESFKSNEEILSTICGHVFHTACWQNWQTRAQTCPDCRLEGPATHRVYLNIEDSSSSQTNLETQNNEFEMKISLLEFQLEESERTFLDSQTELHRLEMKISELSSEIDCQKAQIESKDQQCVNLQEELENCEKNISYLVEKINQKEEQLRTQFEDKEEEFSKLISEKENSEMNILKLVEQGVEKDEKIKEQNVKIDFLKLQNHSRAEEITRLKGEIERKQSNLAESQQLHLTLEKKLKISDHQIIKLNADLKNLNDSVKNGCDRKLTEKEIESEKSRSENIVANITLEEEVKVLREKLKQISLRLEKEIMQTTNLSVDNMKLRSLLHLTLSPDEKKKLVNQMDEKQQCKDLDSKSDSS